MSRCAASCSRHTWLPSILRVQKVAPLQMSMVATFRISDHRNIHTKATDSLSRWLMIVSKMTTQEEWKEFAMHDAIRAQALEAEKAFLANDEPMSAEEWAEKDRLDREAHQQYWEEKGRVEMIISMLNYGLSPEQIATISKRPLSEILKIASQPSSSEK